MAAKRHVMGLHTREERNKAYGMAKQEYELAIKGGGPLNRVYGLGYLQAILDLAEKEAPDERELYNLTFDLWDDLNSRI